MEKLRDPFEYGGDIRTACFKLATNILGRTGSDHSCILTGQVKPDYVKIGLTGQKNNLLAAVSGGSKPETSLISVLKLAGAESTSWEKVIAEDKLVEMCCGSSGIDGDPALAKITANFPNNDVTLKKLQGVLATFER